MRLYILVEIYATKMFFLIHFYTLNRAWNSAGKDGGEEAQLLIHMWIGLFYSRSTPRFIHSSPLDLVDCPEKSDGIVSAPTIPETAPGHLDGQDLEPFQEDQHFLNQGEEILDLSIKKLDVNDGSDVSVSHHEMKGKEASEAITRDAGRPDEGPAQCLAIHRPWRFNLFIGHPNYHGHQTYLMTKCNQWLLKMLMLRVLIR